MVGIASKSNDTVVGRNQFHDGYWPESLMLLLARAGALQQSPLMWFLHRSTHSMSDGFHENQQEEPERASKTEARVFLYPGLESAFCPILFVSHQ